MVLEITRVLPNAVQKRANVSSQDIACTYIVLHTKCGLY